MPHSVYGAIGAPMRVFVASMKSPIPSLSHDANGEEAKKIKITIKMLSDDAFAFMRCKFM
jgi:hypothetical protein